MDLEFALLGWLATREMTGYEVNRWLVSEAKYLGFDRYSSQVYRYLNRMHARGLISYTLRVRPKVPNAKVYRVTDAGLQTLRDWVASPFTTKAFLIDPEFSLRIECAAMLDLNRCLELLRDELTSRRDQVSRDRDRDRSIANVGGRPEVDLEYLVTVREEEHLMGALRVDQHIKWVEQLIEALERQRAKREVQDAERKAL